ncbi:MAG TPA: diacylglycerol kinase [Woeseiaceae bacterium]|nr:diacylglycerol kinase [Woeseiaceae bacterium]
MAKPGNTGLRRILHAATYSVQGFAHAWRFEAAFRQELTLSLVLVPVAFWLGRSAIEVLLLIVSCLLVLVVELLNSAIETTVDRIGAEANELSGRAKDIGSAAVFVSLVIVLIVWGTVAWQRFIS